MQVSSSMPNIIARCAEQLLKYSVNKTRLTKTKGQIAPLMVTQRLLFVLVEQEGETTVPDRYWETIFDITGDICGPTHYSEADEEYRYAYEGIDNKDVRKRYLLGENCFYPFASPVVQCLHKYYSSLNYTSVISCREENTKALQELNKLQHEDNMDVFYNNSQVGWDVNYRKLCAIICHLPYTLSHNIKVVKNNGYAVEFKRYSH